jgi:predicted enzyme related to lactoylglutathione lyase
LRFLFKFDQNDIGGGYLKSKSVTQFVRTVYSSEELTELVAYTKQAGGVVLGTYSNRAGAGISVKIQVPADNRKE